MKHTRMDLKHTCMRTDRLHPMDIVIECPASLLAKEFLVECAANIVNIVNIDFAIEDILAKVFAV